MAKAAKKVAKKATKVAKVAKVKKVAKVAKVAKVKRPAKNTKFMAPVAVSTELAAIVGRGPLPRTEVTKKLWEYIKKHKLQDDKNRRNINPDEVLAKVLGKKTINMFEMTKLVSKHLG